MAWKHQKRLIWQLIILVTVLVALGATFLVIAINAGGWLDAFDQWWLDVVLSWRAGWLNVVFLIFTNFVNPVVLGLIGFGVLFLAKRQRSNCLVLFLNAAVMALLNLALKACFQCPRPDAALRLVSENGFSFPSGHAMLAVAVYGFLIYMIWQTNWHRVWRWLATAAGVVIILLVGLSRVYLAVHFASDVLAAYCVGTMGLLCLIFFLHYCRYQIQTTSHDYKQHHFLAGFKYALAGVYQAFVREFNLTVQFACMMLVILFGVCLQIAVWEWCVVLVLCFGILALELVNTALENLCDKITLEKDATIKYVKDVAAGAVLLLSIGALVVGTLIFLPKMLLLFY